MPWEQRGARRYYYLPARVNGKPRRIYLGTGDEGRLHELLTFRARRLRGKRVQAVNDRMAAIAGAGMAVRELVDWVRQFVRGVRLLGGEYQHQGQWRRRGKPRTPPPDSAAEADWQAEVGMTDADDNPYQRLERLNELANRRDRSALSELSAVLEAGSALWVEFAERVRGAVDKWADLMAVGDEGAVAEAIRQTTDWSIALAGETPTPAVRAAADAAGVAYLAVRFSEAEVSATPAGRRSAILGRMELAVKRLQQAVDLVVAAKAACKAAAAALSGEPEVSGRVQGGGVAYRPTDHGHSPPFTRVAG